MKKDKGVLFVLLSFVLTTVGSICRPYSDIAALIFLGLGILSFTTGIVMAIVSLFRKKPRID